MSSFGWGFFLDHRMWSDEKRLFIRFQDVGRNRLFVAPFIGVSPESVVSYDTPTLAESRSDTDDGLGDVTGFLQAALDCAWEQGMRPTGFADHTNELIAVRYHLEDMRALAKVPPRSKP